MMRPSRTGAGEAWRSRPASGSVLVVVLVTILFATTALTVFIERASNDLLVEAREADINRLQLEAHSALETTLAVLEDFRIVQNGLRSPAEGWGEPLEWSGYQPGEGRRVEVAFADESGKLSLPQVDYATLVNLFLSWELQQADAERLADALLGWVQPDYTPQSATAPRREDYENAPLGFHPPERPLRSFSELRAIDIVREYFFDELGRPTDLGRSFMEAVSLYDFARPNINAAPGSVLAAVGRYDPRQQRQLDDFRRGEGAYVRSPRFFRSANEVATVLGEQGVAAGFGAEIQALRITVTVREGVASYQLQAVVAPPGGARVVEAPAIPEPRAEGRTEAPPPARRRNEQETAPAAAGLDYPFALLEIRENAAISPAPAEPLPDDVFLSLSH